MKQVRVGRPVTVGEAIIVPLEEVTVYCRSKKAGLLAYVCKEPVGIIIGTPQGRWAVDVCGEPMPLEPYIQTVDGLQQVLDAL